MHINKKKQSGTATVFIVLMIGVAVSVTTLGVLHETKNIQERQVSLHAQSAAQTKAWRGAEIVREYLNRVNGDQLNEWAQGGQPVSLTVGGEDNYQVVVRRVTHQGTNTTTGISRFDVATTITATSHNNQPSQSSSILEVTYDVYGRLGESTTTPTTPGTPSVAPAINVFNIYRDLNMTGGITVVGGQNANFNVTGDVVLDRASIDGINTINATGNVSIGSGIKVNNVHSNGDVTLTGSAGVSQIKARGDVTISGGTSSLSIQSNGVTTLKGGSVASVDAIEGVVVNGGGINVSSIRTEGDVNWTGTGGGASIIRSNGSVMYAAGNRQPTNIYSQQHVTLTGGGATKVVAGGNVFHNASGAVGEIQAGGNVAVSSSGSAGTVRTQGNTSMTGSGNVTSLQGQGDLLVNGWQSVSGSIGGTLNKTQTWNGSVNVSVNKGMRVDVETPPAVDLPEVPEVSVPPPQVVDVYALREAANYVFEYRNGKIRVTVNAVSGIPSGEYVLGNKVANYNTYPDYLCKEADMSGTTCQKPIETICQGFSPQNSCFSYNTSTKMWSVNGKSMARGLVWFEGDLTLGNGKYINTFLATGNISTAGGHKTSAPNYVGYALTCQNAAMAGESVNSNFQNLIPTNLCGEGEMLKNGLANSAFIAGGYNPTTGAFGGGIITLGASTVAEGSVAGADVINTGGSTIIKGTVLAAAQNQNNTSPVIFSGSTTIDLTGGSPNYDSTVLPCMQNCHVETIDGGSAGARKNVAMFKWVRYR